MGIRARVRRLVQKVRPRRQIPFESSASYWETRYRQRGGNSGQGSYGQLADFKAGVVNQLVEELDIKSIVEWGCGDGAQLGKFDVPQYIGVDVAPAAVEICRARYANDPAKTFVTTAETVSSPPEGDMALSLDVIYHLVEDDVFESYMKDLFTSAQNCVAIYSNDDDESHTGDYGHVRDRSFTEWITQHIDGWELNRRVDNPYPFDPDNPNRTSVCDFFIFRPTG